MEFRLEKIENRLAASDKQLSCGVYGRHFCAIVARRDNRENVVISNPVPLLHNVS